MYYRYGHVDKIKVKVGDKIWKGQLIAQNGTGNGQWYAHTHFDILTYKPAKWTNYVIGQSKAWVEARYADPRGLARLVMPTYDHLGYGWLWDADYGGKHAFHSGLDLNGAGSGNADLDDPIHSACDGVVEYIYNGSGSNSGWGKIIIIRELTIKQQTMDSKLYEQIRKTIDWKFDKDEEKDQEEAAEKLEDYRHNIERRVEGLEKTSETYHDLVKEHKISVELAGTLTKQNADLVGKMRELSTDRDDLIKAGIIMEDTIEKFEKELGSETLFKKAFGKLLIIIKKTK